MPNRTSKKKKSGRVKNIQKDFYSGKKKKHTIKTQVVYCPGTKQIISIAQDTGKVHDFRIFKESETCFLPKTRVSVDSGYQGIVRLHSNSLLPKKRNKKNPLTEEDRRINREISSERVEIENVFGEMKRFRIIAEKYRNRRKRFGIRFTIIASIFNKHQKVKTGL
ncbi:MAG: transposase [Bacteriovoracaceae bacterium]|nr:transposase [Bacteriovoracaceae bacterium]